MINATFPEKPSMYSYFPLKDGTADVIIRIFDHEETTEDGDTMYVCKTNTFNVEQSKVTESMIAENPEKYLTYTPVKEVTELDRIEALEAAMLELMGVEV